MEVIEMRTNIMIDDTLMDEALKLSEYKTKKETVEEALRLYVSMKNQSSIRSYKGKLHWDGNLEKMRISE
jgi:Arc/MetJ family transcription regulator